jgi:hypothetical protein
MLFFVIETGLRPDKLAGYGTIGSLDVPLEVLSRMVVSALEAMLFLLV